jgi:hypothetical protein
VNNTTEQTVNDSQPVQPLAEICQFDCEYTDTFGGEANYSWVRRAEIAVPEHAPQRTVMRPAKAALGLTGCAGKTTSYGDTYEFRPAGSCTVLFVTFRY